MGDKANDLIGYIGSKHQRERFMALKAQAAAEYLVLLAMVLIVSLIGIVLLGGFGETGGATMDAESKAYWSGTARPFAITEWMQVGDTVFMIVKNTESKRFVLKNISLNNVTRSFGAAGWSIGPNSEKNLTINGLTTCNKTIYDTYEYNVSIYYDTSDLPGLSQRGAKPLAGKCVFT